MATVSQTTTTLSSEASTDEVLGKTADVHLYVSSSFSGTWALQAFIVDRWATVESGTEADLPYLKRTDFANVCRQRVTVTAHTSGTLGCVLDGTVNVESV